MGSKILFFPSKEMERQQTPGNDERLQPDSVYKFRIQRQLLAFIIAFFEDHLEGFHAEERDMDEHENPYAYFLIGQMAEKYAVWFETLCLPDKTGERVQGPWKVQDFIRCYDGQPQKVLKELVESQGYTDAEQYLRELTEWFKVNSTQEESRSGSRDSILTIPMGVHVIHKEIMAAMNRTMQKSA